MMRESAAVVTAHVAPATAPDRTAVTGRAGRWSRLALAALGSYIVSMALFQFGRGDGLHGGVQLGGDYQTYMEAAGRWLAGGSFYPAAQLAGPYELVTMREVLYPPTSIPLFALFSVLPAVLWWAIPTAVLAWSVWRHRPSPLAWVLIAVAAVTPWTWALWINGNPVMWAVAALALATHYGWAGPAILVKPTLAPLALVGVRTRGWWLLLAAGLGIALLFLPLWGDYLTVLRNAHGGRAGLLYSLGDVSFASIPIVAWLGRSQR
jgi:hypothetical protein